MEFLPLSRRRSSPRNVPGGEERGETDVFASYELSRNYRCVRFVNLSMSSLGVFSDECSTFLDMMNDIGIDKKQQLYIIKKMTN